MGSLTIADDFMACLALDVAVDAHCQYELPWALGERGRGGGAARTRRSPHRRHLSHTPGRTAPA